MSDKRERNERVYRRRYPSIFWPVLLITAGILFLLDNLGYVNVNFWELWRLWPVLIILAGLDLLLARRSAIGSLIVLLLTIVVIGGIVWIAVSGTGIGGGGDRGGGSTMDVAQPLGSIERASLELDFVAGQLAVDRLDGGANAVEGTLDLATQSRPEWTFTPGGGQAEMKLAYDQNRGNVSLGFNRADDWRLHLSPQVTFDLTANVAAGDARLDLTGLNVRTLKVSSGASQTTVILPGQGDVQADISGGVGSLVIEIPSTMAVRLRSSRGLAALSVPGRYTKQGDMYVAGDWDTAENRVDIELSLGVGSVSVREP